MSDCAEDFIKITDDIFKEDEVGVNRINTSTSIPVKTCDKKDNSEYFASEKDYFINKPERVIIRAKISHG